MSILEKLKSDLKAFVSARYEINLKISEVKKKIALESCPFVVGDYVAIGDCEYQITSISYRETCGYRLHGKKLKINGELYKRESTLWDWNNTAKKINKD